MADHDAAGAGPGSAGPVAWADGAVLPSGSGLLNLDHEEIMMFAAVIPGDEGDKGLKPGNARFRDKDRACSFDDRDHMFPGLREVRPGSGGYSPPSADTRPAVIPGNQPQQRERLKLLQDGQLARFPNTLAGRGAMPQVTGAANRYLSQRPARHRGHRNWISG